MSSPATFSQASRELKVKHQEMKNEVTHRFDRRQIDLDYTIELLRNERSYYIARLNKGDDLDEMRAHIDELSEKIARYRMEKIELDRERKAAINTLKHRQNKEIDALETEYSKRGGGL